MLFGQVYYSVELVLDVLEAGDFGFGLFYVQTGGVVGIEFGEDVALFVAFLEEFVVIEAAVVGRYAIEVAHIDCLGAFFVGEEGFVHLLSVADADDFDGVLETLCAFAFEAAACLLFEELAYGFCLGLDGAGGSFLDEDVAILAVFEGEEDEVNGLFETHNEAGHLGLGEGDGVAAADLVYPEGDDASAGAHHIAVTGAADFGAVEGAVRIVCA